MDRPLILNSLLTFIHNFHDHHRLRCLVKEYFTSSDVLVAQSILEERCNVKGDVFILYETLEAEGRLPIFVAADLSAMPIALIGDSEKHEMLREMRNLRRFMTDALNGRLDDSPPHSRAYCAEEILIASKLIKAHSSASSPEIPSCTPSSTLGQLELDTSSSSMASSAKSSDCCETKQDMREPTPEKQEDDVPAKRKRMTGRSLDAAVAKLNDIHRTRSEPIEPSPSPPAPPPQALPPPQPVLPQSAAVQHSTIQWAAASAQLEAQSYINMIQKLVQHQQHQQALAIQAEQEQRALQQHQLLHQQMLQQQALQHAEEDSKLDDELNDDDKYDDSSPSPSEDREDGEEGEGNKPHVCPHMNCAKRFANKFLLKKHQFIHTGLRPHACPYCTKRFNRKDNLLRHKKTHLVGEEYLHRPYNLLLARHDALISAVDSDTVEIDDDE